MGTHDELVSLSSSSSLMFSAGASNWLLERLAAAPRFSHQLGLEPEKLATSRLGTIVTTRLPHLTLFLCHRSQVIEPL